MNIENIYANQRVLYKGPNHAWRVGHLVMNGALLQSDGLFFMVQDEETNGTELHVALNDLFLDARELQDWVRDRDNHFLYTKEEFISMLQDEDFDIRSGTAYMSDGEYEYYKVAHFNENWINRQPFKYIVWYT